MKRMILAGVLLIAGCEQDDPITPPPPTTAPPATRPTWTNREGERLAHGELTDSLRAAIEAARKSLNRARLAWASAEDRDSWALKWETRTGPDRLTIEHLWVIPVTWTEYRVEGVLASLPLQEFDRKPGDLVSFDSDEILDWVHTLDGPAATHLSGQREGGYTVDELRNRYGVPIQ